jgi:hypothetical protein
MAMRTLALPFRRLTAAFGAAVEGFGFGHFLDSYFWFLHLKF